MKNKLKIYCVFIFGILTIQGSLAQSDLKLTDFYYNPIVYNPAYAGAQNALVFKGLFSSQWLGFEGSPSSQIFDIQNRYSDGRNGVALDIHFDKFGAVSNFNVEGNYAYYLSVNNNTSLVFGLKAGLSNFQINYDKLNIYDPDEDIYNNGNLNEIKPIAGIGLYLFQKNWFVSVSTPNLLKTKFESDYQISTTKISHYYIVAGGNIDISDEFQLNSQLLTRIVSGAPISYLFSTRMFFKDKISLGIHFEPNNILGVFTSVEVVEGLDFGFGYDYSINELSKYSNGNYSITMAYKFKTKDKYSWKFQEQVKSPYVLK